VSSPPSPSPSPSSKVESAQELSSSRSKQGFWQNAWRRYRKDRVSMIGLMILILMFVVALFSPLIVGTKPILCSYQGIWYFPFLGYYHRSWENPIFLTRDKFGDLYPGNLQNQPRLLFEKAQKEQDRLFRNVERLQKKIKQFEEKRPSEKSSSLFLENLLLESGSNSTYQKNVFGKTLKSNEILQTLDEIERLDKELALLLQERKKKQNKKTSEETLTLLLQRIHTDFGQRYRPLLSEAFLNTLSDKYKGEALTLLKEKQLQEIAERLETPEDRKTFNYLLNPESKEFVEYLWLKKDLEKQIQLLEDSKEEVQWRQRELSENYKNWAIYPLFFADPYNKIEVEKIQKMVEQGIIPKNSRFASLKEIQVNSPPPTPPLPLGLYQYWVKTRCAFRYPQWPTHTLPELDLKLQKEQEQIEALKKEIQSSQEKIQSLKNRISPEEKAKITQLEETLKTLEAQKDSRIRRNFKALQQHLKTLKQQQELPTKEILALENSILKKQSQIEIHQKNLQEVLNAKKTPQSLLDTLEERLRQKEEKRKAVQEQLLVPQEALRSLSEKRANLEERFKHLKNLPLYSPSSSSSSVTEGLTQLEKEMQHLQKQVQGRSLKEEQDSLSQEWNTLKQQIKALENDKEAFQKQFALVEKEKEDLLYQKEVLTGSLFLKHQQRLQHLFGTDKYGRDVFARIVHGTRIALLVGFVSMGIASLIGLFFGSIAGFFGGKTDIFISRLIDFVMAVPSLILILALMAVVQNPPIWYLMVVIGITSWPSIARLTRGEFLKLRNLDYVMAGKALGFSNSRLIFRHILPNALAPVIVNITFGIASAILTESGLSFLGFGVQEPVPSWGSILSLGFQSGLNDYWLIGSASFAIFTAIVTYNIVGDGLQEALDPRLK
jgi:ABC-type dipeptide/oligopeptide/nickel transport system permease subunit